MQTNNVPSAPARSRRTLLLVLLLALCGPAIAAQETFDARRHYLKTELMIPMRDGVELFTQIYEPLESDGAPYPILLFRTPYGIGFYGDEMRRQTLGPSPLFTRSKYVFVYQDVRGKYRSEGDFEVMNPVRSRLVGGDAVDECTDTYDTVDWLIENLPDHNGRVGQWGISYPGWQTVMGMIDAHPAMKASSPQASPADMFIGDDFHHNGAFRLMYTFGWLSSAAASRTGQSSTGQGVRVDYGTSNGYEFFLDLGPLVNVDRRYFGGRVPTWNDYMEHGTYDRYWREQDVLQHMKGIEPAVLNVAGWFDAEDFYGPMSIYYEIEKNDPRNDSILVVGPWQHGGWAGGTGEQLGSVRFPGKPSEFYRNEVEFPFFEAHLKGDGEPHLAEAIVYETGLGEWRAYESWPPPGVEARRLYLRAGGRLSFDPPTEGGGYDEFVSDPQDPVPFSATPGLVQGHTWMVEDQRFCADRPDVLVYRTAPLEEDVRVAGPIVADLRVSTTGTDADWIVKLIDEVPEDAPVDGLDGGYQMLVAGEVMRSKFRDGFEHPEPLVPGEVTRVRFDLRDKFHRFRRGHRIMVQIQSSWFPVIDRNPHRFMDIYKAEADDFTKATHRVHRSVEDASRLELLVLPLGD